MERIAALYFKPEHHVADVTFGKGVFWKKIDTPSTISTRPI